MPPPDQVASIVGSGRFQQLFSSSSTRPQLGGAAWLICSRSGEGAPEAREGSGPGGTPACQALVSRAVWAVLFLTGVQMAGAPTAAAFWSARNAQRCIFDVQDVETQVA